VAVTVPDKVAHLSKKYLKESDRYLIHLGTDERILSCSHLLLDILSGIFPLGFSTKILCISRLLMCATCHANLILFDSISIIIFDVEYKLRSSTLCNFLHPLVTSSPVGPNIPLSKRSNTCFVYINSDK